MAIPSSDLIRLSEQQMLAVAAAATPLAVRARGLFLERWARAIARQPEVGDGSLYRLIARVQRKYYDPPITMSGGAWCWGRSEKGPRPRREARRNVLDTELLISHLSGPLDPRPSRLSQRRRNRARRL